MIFINYILISLIIIFIFLISTDKKEKFNLIKNESDNSYVLEKQIFTYYDYPDEIIKSHYDTWKRKFSPEWKLIFLNKNNIGQYVNKNFITEYNNLDPVRFSDFLRLYLLFNYGGIWMDGGIFVTNGEFINNYYKEMINNRYDVCLYEYKVMSLDFPHLDNWFIISPKNSIFIKDLYDEFKNAYKLGFLEYKKKILLPSKIKLDNTIGYGDDTYLLQHVIMKYLLKNNPNKYKINIKIAEKSMFKIHEKYDWTNGNVDVKDNNILDEIINKNDWTDYYAIKLTGRNRKAITGIKKHKYIDKMNFI